MKDFDSEGPASTFFGTYQNQAWLLGFTFGF
jgi:hypothetical protein